MKALFALLAVIIAALILWAFNEPSDEQTSDSPSSTSVEKSSSSNPARSSGVENDQAEQSDNPGTGRTRVIGKPKPQGLTATWHPEKKGIFISPYNQEELKAIGVVSGSRVKDSDGNEVIVPPFEDSPEKLYPVSTPIPDRPGYVFNPYTQGEVDVRGIPKGTVVQDPQDPGKEAHRFRTPGE